MLKVYHIERGLLIQVFKSPQEIDPDFGIWENPEYWALESGIQLKKSGIALTSPGSTDKNWNPVPGIRNPLRRIQNSITWDDFKRKCAELA